MAMSADMSPRSLENMKSFPRGQAGFEGDPGHWFPVKQWFKNVVW
jgi:hypothetical protein